MYYAKPILIIFFISFIGCGFSNDDDSSGKARPAAEHSASNLALKSASLKSRKINSGSQSAQVRVARVVRVVDLLRESDLEAKVVVIDLGGSTDLSPTKKIYFTLYNKGEMFSTDAAFDLGNYMDLISAEKLNNHSFKVKVENLDINALGIQKEEYIIDASEAAKSILNIDCGDEFDCKESVNFEATIDFKKL